MTPERFRYTADIDLSDVNDAHVLAIGRVPSNSRVLDLGAADGSVAAVLKDMGCRVWGVEIDPTAAETARRFCEEVAVEDLTGLDLRARFAGQQFDVVLMLDILEHLGDPAAVLKQVAAVLADGGWGVISLPNVAHMSVRLALLDGKFSYTDTGLLDRTHLRFFDRPGVDDLLSQAGWDAFEVARVTRGLRTTEIDVDDPDPSLVEQLGAEPDAFTYQFVVSAAPEGSPLLARPPTLPSVVAQNLCLGAAHQISELQAELRQTVPPGLQEQLTNIRQGSLDRQSQLRHLLAAMREDADRIRTTLSN